jgi:hypothetical protein
MELSEFRIEKIDNDVGRSFLEKYHYTHSCNLLIISYGFYYDNNLKCVVGFSRPSGKNLARSIWENGTDYNTLELIRLFSFDDCPKNTESYCISQSIKYLKEDMPDVKILVSYADSSAGHIGYIYQASNWKYIGTGSNERKIFIDGERQHRRSLYGKYGTSSIVELKERFGDRLQVSEDRFPKNKYVYVVGKNKFETKQIYSELKTKILPYPKGQIKYYNEGQSEFNTV